jgi:hypothetical protein
MAGEIFTVQYYDYYGHLITTALSEPTISTIIPSITYKATYSQVATLLSPSRYTSTESTSNLLVTVTPTTLIDTASTTILEIVVLPTSPLVQSGTRLSQTSQLDTKTSEGTLTTTPFVNSATITVERTSSKSPTASGHHISPGGVHGGAIAGIAISAAFTVLFLLALGWWLMSRCRRTVESQSAVLNRAESNGYRKAELEGTVGSSTFEWKPKPELPGSEEIMHDVLNNTFSREPASTSHTQRLDIHQEQEPRAVSRVNSQTRGSQIPFSPTATSPTQPLEEPSTSAAMGLPESAAVTESVDLLRMNHSEMPSPKNVPVIDSSSQDHAVVDASQLNRLKAQARELAEYIEAHETLQKLKNEHIALQERIRAAEERAQRSKISDVD